MDILNLRNRKASAVIALFLVLALVAGVMPGAAAAATSSEIQEEIDVLEEKNDAIQAEINAIRKLYNANFSEMEDMVAKKNAIDQEMTLLNDKIITLNDQIRAYSQLIADTQEELDNAQDRLSVLSEEYRERVRAMEEEGGVTYWEVIFKANSFVDLLDRLNMMEEISAADQRRLQEMRAAADIVTATQLNLESEKATLEESRKEVDVAQAELEERRQEADEILIELEKKSAEFQALLDESEALQDDLMKEIAQKEKELKEAKYDERLAQLAAAGQNPPSNSTWVRPLSSLNVTSPFGMRLHPVLGYTRMHNGIDLGAASGTPIYATRSGKVTVASYQAGGAGNYVSINHLDGFSSIYMHMTHYVVSVGQTVSAGQVIGYVGSTGISTGPHLHFGISYAGTYVNPLAYIY